MIKNDISTVRVSTEIMAILVAADLVGAYAGSGGFWLRTRRDAQVIERPDYHRLGWRCDDEVPEEIAALLS